jgi:hypothetical protein
LNQCLTGSKQSKWTYYVKRNFNPKNGEVENFNYVLSALLSQI